MKDGIQKFRQAIRLVRLPQVPTAAADSAAGAVLAQHVFGLERPYVAGMVILASLLLYAGGMVFNDLAHVERDRTIHPDRPLPSGAVSRETAYGLGISLFLAGVVSAAWGGWVTLLLAVGLVGGILLYNYTAATHPVFGPLLMGALRSGNFVLGLSLAGVSVTQWTGGMVLAFGIGLHIVCVTLISVLEETPEARFFLKTYAGLDVFILVLLSGYLLFLPQGKGLPVWMTAAGFLPLAVYLLWFRSRVRAALAYPSAASVGRIVGVGVQGVILIHATNIAVLGQPLKGAALLLLFVPIAIARWT